MKPARSADISPTAEPLDTRVVLMLEGRVEMARQLGTPVFFCGVLTIGSASGFRPRTASE